MNKQSEKSEEFILPTEPINYSFKDGILTLGTGESKGLVTFDKVTGELSVKEVLC